MTNDASTFGPATYPPYPTYPYSPPITGMFHDQSPRDPSISGRYSVYCQSARNWDPGSASNWGPGIAGGFTPWRNDAGRSPETFRHGEKGLSERCVQGVSCGS